jgi:shikimate dehydrogenase
MPVWAESRIRGATHVAGIIGWPVDRSLSPAIHNAAFGAAGIDWVYVPLPVPPTALARAIAGIGALGIHGANVTMPHKSETADLLQDLSEDARVLRAVNTIMVRGNRLEGHNTDAPGFDRFLRQDAGVDPAGRTALIYGSGGAARACALALARGDVAGIVVAARDRIRAEPIRSLAESHGVPSVTIVDPHGPEGIEVDLAINATPVGVRGEELALPSLGPGVVVVDLIYDPVVTPLQRRAKEAGAAAFGGLGLLLQQAALSFELWTGTPAPLEVMSAAALGVLADR